MLKQTVKDKWKWCLVWTIKRNYLWGPLLTSPLVCNERAPGMGLLFRLFRVHHFLLFSLLHAVVALPRRDWQLCQGGSLWCAFWPSLNLLSVIYVSRVARRHPEGKCQMIPRSVLRPGFFFLSSPEWCRSGECWSKVSRGKRPPSCFCTANPS